MARENDPITDTESRRVGSTDSHLPRLPDVVQPAIGSLDQDVALVAKFVGQAGPDDASGKPSPC